MNACVRFLRHFLVGNLTVGLSFTPLFLLPVPVRAQRVTSPSPSIGAEDVEPSSAISATFKAESGITVLPETVKVFVDDVDVSGQSVITSEFFSYRAADALTPGEHVVQLEFTNSAGQDRQAQWSFTVGAGVVAEIESVSHNASNDPLATGQDLLITVNGTPSSTVSAFLVRDGATVKSLSMQEVSSGVYVANLRVAEEDLTDEGIVVARLERDSQIRFATADLPLQLVAETPEAAEEVALEGTGVDTAEITPELLQPKITSHKNGDGVSGSSFELMGTTAPNATVAVSGVASNSLGGLISTERSLATRSVQADDAGNFSIQVSTGIPTIAGSVYKLEIVGSARGVSSPLTTLELTQK